MVLCRDNMLLIWLLGRAQFENGLMVGSLVYGAKWRYSFAMISKGLTRPCTPCCLDLAPPPVLRSLGLAGTKYSALGYTSLWLAV